jgi:hypothetical protein
MNMCGVELQLHEILTSLLFRRQQLHNPVATTEELLDRKVAAPV